MIDFLHGAQKRMVVRACLLLALAGGGFCGVVAWRGDPAMSQAWLLGALLWSGISIGSLFWHVLHQRVGGRWGEELRPGFIVVARPLWLMAMLIVPLAFVLPDIYPWAQAEVVAHDPRLAAKAAYLNIEFFQIRGAGYLVLCLATASILARSTGGRLAGGAAALALPLLGFAGTFAAVDWMMSLEPHWYSSVYGLEVLAGQAVAGLAAAVIWTVSVSRARCAEISEQTWRDIGNLLLAAVCFWMYLVATQFLIVWSGNLAEETPWYLTRSRGGLQWVITAIVLFHFVVPFALLLSRRIKQHPRSLACVAWLLVVMHAVELWWLVVPAFPRSGPWPYLLDLLAIVTLGSAWLAVTLFHGSAYGQSRVESHE